MVFHVLFQRELDASPCQCGFVPAAFQGQAGCCCLCWICVFSFHPRPIPWPVLFCAEGTWGGLILSLASQCTNPWIVKVFCTSEPSVCGRDPHPSVCGCAGRGWGIQGEGEGLCVHTSPEHTHRVSQRSQWGTHTKG